MNEFNPYAPPQSDLAHSDNAEMVDIVLAERGTRLGASFLDGLILSIPVFLLLWGFYSLLGLHLLEPVIGAKKWIVTLGAGFIGILIDLAVNGYLLKTSGQTVGKRICKIKIVKQDGLKPTLFDSFVKRRVVIACIQQIPFFGNLFALIDVLFIFRESRRCLHDDLAGTIVVKA